MHSREFRVQNVPNCGSMLLSVATKRQWGVVLLMGVMMALTISPLTLFLFCSVGVLLKWARSSDHSASNWPNLVN